MIIIPMLGLIAESVLITHPALGQFRSHLTHGRCGQEDGHGEFNPQGLRDLGQEAGREQRVAPGREEVIGHSEGWKLQEVAPNHQQILFLPGIGRHSLGLVGGCGRELSPQGMAVDFTIARQWHRLGKEERGGQHVGGKGLPEVGSQGAGVHKLGVLHLLVEADRRRQALAAVGLKNQCAAFGNAGMPLQAGLDLSQFDPLAVQLDLMIRTPNEGKASLRVPLEKIGGEERPAIRVGGGLAEWRVGGGGVFPVTPHHRGALHQQTAFLVVRQWPSLPVDNRQPVSFQRISDGHDPFRRKRQVRSDFEAETNAILGGPEDIDEPCVRLEATAQQLDIRAKQGFAGDVEGVDPPGDLRIQLGSQAPEQGRNHAADGDPSLGQLLAELAGRQGSGGKNDHRAPPRKTAEQFPDPAQERRGQHVGHAVLRLDPQHSGGLPTLVQEHRPVQRNPLGPAGRTRGVEQEVAPCLGFRWNRIRFDEFLTGQDSDSRKRLGKARLPVRITKHQRHPGLLDDLMHPVERRAGLDRHHRGPAVQRPEDRDRQVEGMIDENSDHEVAGTLGQRGQPSGDRAGKGVQFRIRDRPILMLQGNPARFATAPRRGLEFIVGSHKC